MDQLAVDLKETLMGTQNKAAEIEIGSALHKHVVASVQNAEVLPLPLNLPMHASHQRSSSSSFLTAVRALIFRLTFFAQVLEGGSDSARIDRLKMTEALELSLKCVADRRQEMMLDDMGVLVCLCACVLVPICARGDAW